MTSITKIAKSNISRSTARIRTATFNTGLYIAEPDSNIVDDFYSVAEAADVLAITGMTTLSPVYLAAAAYFSGARSPDTFMFGQKLAGDADHGAALNRMINAGAKPYFIAAETTVTSEVASISTYANAAGLLYIGLSELAADKVAANTSTAETLNSDRTLMIFQDAPTYNDLRFIGYMAAATTGSWSADSTLLNGAVVTNLTDPEYDGCIANRMNIFADFGGNIVFQDGQVSSGEWVDVIVNLDWVDARIEEELALLKIRLDTIPYTEDGITLERTAIMGVLGKARDLGIFSSWELLSETAESQGSTTRATRKYAGHKWTATLAGAIKYTEVNGNVGA
jgi:hypothetical protein